MGKNYVESSLKRFLKRKVKITMGFVVAFMITGTIGFAAPFTGDAILENNGKNPPAIQDETLILDNESLKTNPKNGILCHNNGNLFINSSNIIINNNVLNQTSDRGYSLAGVQTRFGGKVNLGTDFTENISIKVHVDTNNNEIAYDTGKEVEDIAIGLLAFRPYDYDTGKENSQIIVNSNNLNIDVVSEKGFAHGIQVYNTTTPENIGDKKRATVIINSKNVVINAKSNATKELNNELPQSNGIIAWSQGIVKINNGNVSITADNIINTRGNSLVEINANNNSENTVVLNGDVIFEYNATQSGTTVESGVKVNLANQSSIFKGKIILAGDLPIPDNKDDVTGMNLSLSNGGTWEVTGDSFVNDLTMNAGVLKVTDNAKKIVVDELHGNSGTALFAASIGDGEVVVPGKVEVKKVTDKTAFKIGLSGINADDLAANGIGAEKTLGELVGKVTGSGVDNITQTAVIERGTLTGEITAELNKDGFTNMKQAQDTPTTAAIRDLTAINYLSWKQEMSSLSQRMGELRDSSAEHGVWARVYGGKVENGSQYDNEYQTYQVGYDKKYTVDNGRVYLGYLVSYTDGETDYSYGTGENYSVGAGIYATWMNNNGHYVDILYKVSRLNNKFDMKDVEDVKGDYDTYGISLSAEYGKRFDITDKWFTEPSVGMHLGRLGDETYTTDGGIEISQDSIYTTEGRIGATVGYKFSDKGNVYARTHVVKEFAGEVDTEYERKGVCASTSEDFGDTWFEFGVGVNYRFTENMNVYADIERTGDSTVDTKWQGNLGFRYEF